MVRSYCRLPVAASFIFITLLAFLVLLLPSAQADSFDDDFPSRTQADGDELWWDGFGYPGVGPGTVEDMVVFQGALIVVGSFLEIQGGPGNGIARWDGASWSPLGSGLTGGPDAAGMALYIYNNQLYVGGSFSMAGGVPANNIAHWDGTTWSALGSGVNGIVYAIHQYSGYIVAGGSFSTAGGVTARNVAGWRLSTQAWTAFGSGTNGPVCAFATYHIYMYAGGSFSQAGGVPASGIAIWAAGAWTSVGSGVNGTVFSLLPYNNELLIGGFFSTAGGISANGIVRWNDFSWTPFGSGVGGSYYGPYVLDMMIDGSDLVISGNFDEIDAIPAVCVARWNGTTWSAFGSGLDYCCSPNWAPNMGRAVAPFNGQIHAGGLFQTAGGIFVSSFGVWDGSEWHAIMPGAGLDNTVEAMTFFEGDLVACGYFYGDGTGVNDLRTVGRWNGSAWSSFGGSPGPFEVLTTWNGELVIGGVGSMVFRWTGTFWATIASYINGAKVSAFATFDGLLVKGGKFGAPAANIAAWNGASWASLGTGISGGTAPEVNALTVYQNQLIAGGSFTTAGGVAADNIAAWDGSAWQPLGTGISGTVFSLAVVNNRLIAGGMFSSAGGNSASNIATWDGSQWTQLGAGIDGRVTALVNHNGALIAGGDFTMAGGNPAAHIAAWNFSDWEALGSGTNGGVATLLSTGGSLYAGGAFERAGGRSSFHIARWDGAVSAVGDPVDLKPPAQILALEENPFRAVTTVEYRVLSSGPVRLTVHDVQGRLVGVLEDGVRDAGTYRTAWTARSGAGALTPGVYWVRLKTAGGVESVRAVLRP